MTKKNQLKGDVSEDSFNIPSTKRTIRYSTRNPKPRTLPEPMYLEWEEALTKATARKVGLKPSQKEEQSIARAKVLKSIHQSMEHPEDLDPIIRYYCSHNIVNKRTQTQLIIYSPEDFQSPRVMSWILDDMARAGCTNIHLLTPAQEQEYNAQVDATPPRCEEYYFDEEKNIHIYREFGVLWVRQNGIATPYDVVDEELYNQEPKVCFKDEKAEVSVYRRMITVRQDGKNKTSDLRRYKEIYG